MKLQDVYVSPNTGEPLSLRAEEEEEGEVVEGVLESKNGESYLIERGIPDFTYPPRLNPSDQSMRDYYDNVADVYDDLLHLTFDTFGVDEWKERDSIIDSLELTPDSVVLEMGCGSGRDTALIAKRLGDGGTLYAQDLSRAFLDKSISRLAEYACEINLACSNGSYLPFPDNHFDAAFHFGGINTFDEIGRAFKEMTRVTKPGGRVVVGDENMPVWLRGTEFGKVLMNSNPHYEYDLPLEFLPVEARGVKLEWLMGGVFYYVAYTVGEGEPYADIDFEIPGVRGGTHRTRYYGLLEGVTSEAKQKAHDAAMREGISLHDWLTQTVINAAKD